jgi:hypothetical protein
MIKEIEFTREEIAAIKGISSAPTLGLTTAKEPIVSVRLVEHGYVTKDEAGHLILTTKGKKSLTRLPVLP